MHLYDTHAHLDYFENIEQVVRLSQDSNVKYINIISVDLLKFDSIIQIANNFDNLYASIGHHPCYLNLIENFTQNDFSDIFKKNIEKYSTKIVAIGECGLDYYISKSNYYKWKAHENQQIQKKFFVYHIEESIRYQLPLIIHMRSSEEDTFDILKHYQTKAVIHCFGGTKKFMFQMLDLGYYISFSGIITFKNADNLRDCLKSCPLDRILIETDAPYLSPEPVRSHQQNQPANIIHTAKFIANFLNLDYENFINITTKNGKKVFNIT